MATTLTSWANNEIFKVKLTFDNGQTYTALSNDDTDYLLVSGDITETTAVTLGNPVGVMEPNTANFEILDKSNNLLSTNASSPYYGYMRNGVKCEVFVSYDDEITWTPYGVYYTENWSSDKEDGGYSTVNISCTDKLDYIGSLPMPTLKAYAGVNVTTLLQNILLGIGLTSSDFNIDSTLSLQMLYAISKGDTVKEALNTIAQSLLARIFLDRAGVIQVVPAIPTKTIAYIIDDVDAEKISVQHNKITQYNKVKLIYNKVSDRLAETLISLSNVSLEVGLNKISGLQITSDVLSIDGAYISTSADDTSNIEKISYINYVAYQGGIDIEVYNATSAAFYADIEVVGRITGNTDAYVESTISSDNATSASTLTLESSVIQDESKANAYVSAVASYLKTMQQEVIITGTLPSQLTVQQYITITSDDTTIDDDYLITEFNLQFGESYTTTVKAVKVV